MARRSSNSQFFDDKQAFEKALSYELPDNVFINPRWKKFMELKDVQCAVTPNMFLGPLLVATSNLMGMSQLAISEDWRVKQNIYLLLIAPKGSGKSHASSAFLQPFVELEEDEKHAFDEHKKRKKNQKKTNKKRKASGEAEVVTEEADVEQMDGDVLEDAPEKNKKGEDQSIRKKSGNNEVKNTEDSEDEAPRGSGDPSEKHMFHPCTRIQDQITPEALMLSLFYGSGMLVIKADEFLGFFNKCIEKADNASAICSAFSGEVIKYTTVKRGEICIYDSRLCIYGCIQPGPLCHLLNSGRDDSQGYWDRHLFLAGSEDPTVQFFDKLKAIPPEDKVDLKLYYKTVKDRHMVARTYKPDKGALEALDKVNRDLLELDISTDLSSLVGGVTKKMFTNIQKIATIYACIRETTDEMFREEKEDEGEEKEDEGEEKEDDGEEKEDEEASDEKFTVTASDVEAAYSFVKQSMITFRCFKSTLDQEMGEDEHESKEVDEEEVIMAAADKIRKIYEKADENHQMYLSVLKRSKFYPSKVGDSKVTADHFVKLLLKFKIAELINKKTNNNKSAEALQLTTKTDNRDTVRVYKILYEKNKEAGQKFDPLKIFSQVN